MTRIAMPLADDFEDSEFRKPYDGLREAGHDVVILGSRSGKVVEGKKKQEEATIDCSADQVRPEDFDALVIPGGVSPDHLRLDEGIVEFVRRFDALGRPIAAVCHGPQLLIEADAIRGRTMTSYPSIKKDLQNAGAKWVDQRVCQDGDLITSRNPDDLDAFTGALLERLEAGVANPQIRKAMSP